MKKFLKAGIAGAMACTLLGSAAVPASAKEVPVNTDQEVTKIAEEVTPRFMYTQTRTASCWQFDAVVVIDTVETNSTSSGWKIVGVQDVFLTSKGHNVTYWTYTYEYYDDYQGCEIHITYGLTAGGIPATATKTIKVHI